MADGKNVININGKEFSEEDLTDQQQYFILQVRDLQQKRSAAQFQVDQLSASLDHFTKQLIASVEPDEDAQVVG